MLRPKPLTDVLKQAATGGVNRVTLLKVDGSLLAFAGEANKDPQVHAALVSNIWGAYISGKDAHDKDGEGTDEEGKRDAHDKEAVRKDTQAKDAAGKEKEKPFSNLGSVMIHCEGGKIVIAKVATVLVALMSDELVGFGMLKAKTDAIVDYLQEPLSKVDMVLDE